MVARKIKPQFYDSTGHGVLAYKIVERALADAFRDVAPRDMQGHIDQKSALTYLSSEMPHCELAGVSSEWVRLIIAKVGLKIPF